MGPSSGYYLSGHMHTRAIWDQAGKLESIWFFVPPCPQRRRSGLLALVSLIMWSSLPCGDGMETGGDHCRRLLGRSRGSSASPYLIRQTAKMDNRYPDVLVGGGAAPAPDVSAGEQPY